MNIEIRNLAGLVLYTATCDDLKAAMEKAARAGAYLMGADLLCANLPGANLRDAYLVGAYVQGANLQGADFRGAYLGGADFRGANLRGAYLRGADFRGAYLGDADLQGAYVQGADFRGANLGGAKGINRFQCTPLLMLLDQPGRIRAYKLVTGSGDSPIHSAELHYEIGVPIEVADADTNPDRQCATGINVADLPWCMEIWKPGYRIFMIEFLATDIACIPTATDGKFRLHRGTPVGEVDLVKIGLVAETAQEAKS